MSAYPNLAKRHKIAYVGTYPPKECGIATFTLDVVNSTDLTGWRSIVFAVDDAAPNEPHPDSKVVYTIEKENKADYVRAAKLLEKHKVSLLSIQHEYGIFGGDHGDYVLELVRAATMPAWARHGLTGIGGVFDPCRALEQHYSLRGRVELDQRLVRQGAVISVAPLLAGRGRRVMENRGVSSLA